MAASSFSNVQIPETTNIFPMNVETILFFLALLGSRKLPNDARL